MKKSIFLLALLLILLSPVTSSAYTRDDLAVAFEKKLKAEDKDIHLEEPIYGDFNLDGGLDMANVVFFNEEMISYIYVVTFDNDEVKILLKKEGAPIESFLKVRPLFHPGLGKEIQGFEYMAKSTGPGLHNYTKYYKYFMFYNGRIRQVGTGFQSYQDKFNDNYGPFQLDRRENEVTNWGSYYNQYPEYDLNYTTEYKFFKPTSVKEIIVDGIMEDSWARAKWVEISEGKSTIYGEENRVDANDLSYQAGTLLNNDTLYIYLRVKDDKVIFDNNLGLKQDHLEIWLNSVNIFDNGEVVTAIENNKEKAGLFQLAVYQDKVVTYFPEESSANNIEHNIQKTNQGYDIEIALPLGDYLEEKIKEYKTIGFTLVVSDSDSIEDPAQDTLMSTSKLRWGDPFSLGKLYLEF